MEHAPRTRILILGGAFAGLTVGMELEKKLAQDPSVEITLINRENFLLFTPTFHEVAAGDLDLTTIGLSARCCGVSTSLRKRSLRSTSSKRRVVVSHGFDHHHHKLEFDFLVLGLGSVTYHYGLPGLQEHALTMKSLGDAKRLRNHLIAHLEEADSDCCKVREPLLAFVVAGGGFAGVETVGGNQRFRAGSTALLP